MCTGNLYSKTTYIPYYQSQIIFIQNQDTIDYTAVTQFAGLCTPDSTLRITVIHEDVDKDKVKLIKRLKRAAGWATVAATFGGISTSLNPVRSPMQIKSYVNTLMLTKSSIDLSYYANLNAEAEMTLGIDYMLENHGNHEIQIADLQRGLIWYLRPNEYVKLRAYNPDIARFRISNADPRLPQDIRYVTITAASILQKRTIQYEDDNYWIYPEEPIDEYAPQEYYAIDRISYELKIMSESEFKKYVKDAKTLNKAE